jgi:hypothetical protein
MKGKPGQHEEDGSSGSRPCNGNGFNGNGDIFRELSGATPGTYGVGTIPGTGFAVTEQNVDIVH